MKNKTGKWLFASVATLILVAAIIVLVTVLTPEQNKAIRNAQNAYEKLLSNETPETECFLYQHQDDCIVAVNGGEISSSPFSTQRQALQWLFDDVQTITDESLGYCTVATEVEKLFSCVHGSPFEGKKVSILGDSISTFDGVSNNVKYNPTLGDHFLYYTPSRSDDPELVQQDTWWQQVIDTLGMELCVNNASSGTRVRTDINGLVNAGYKERCVQLHNTQGEEPDVILVFMGTNDFTRDNINLGRLKNLDYSAVQAAAAEEDPKPETVYEAYAIMLCRIQKRYPNAQIYCMTLLPRRATAISGKEDYSQYGQPTWFNADLRAIAEYFGCTVIDLENCGIPNDGPDFDYYIADQGLHPGKYGMDMISNAVIRTMLGE